MATTSLVLGVLSLFCLALAGIPAIVFGFLGLSRAKAAGTGQGMAIAGMALGLVGTLLTGGAVWLGWKAYKGAERIVQTARTEMEVGEDRDKGIELMLAAHNHHDGHARLPNPYSKQPRPGVIQPRGQEPARPLLSWRVDLLPFGLQEDNLYRRFQMDQPWDSPANRPLASQHVEPYVFSYDPPGSSNTRWRGFSGPGAVFEPGTQARIPGSFPDGTSNTLFCVESAEAVGWTEPNDYPFTNPHRPAAFGGPKGPAATLPVLGRPGADGFLMVMCDGSVRYVRKSIDPKTLAMLIDGMDGNIIPGGWEIDAGLDD
jgi:hypothetical protein